MVVLRELEGVYFRASISTGDADGDDNEEILVKINGHDQNAIHSGASDLLYSPFDRSNAIISLDAESKVNAAM